MANRFPLFTRRRRMATAVAVCACWLTGCPVPTEPVEPDTPAVRNPPVVATTRAPQGRPGGYGVSTPATVAGAAGRIAPDSILEHEAFNRINTERLQRRLKPLAWDPALADVARRYAQECARRGKLDHRGERGSTLRDRISGLSWTEAGENLARNKGWDDPVDQAVKGWIKSPEHAANMFSQRYRATGMGVARTPDGYFYFCQVFTVPAMP